MNSEPRFTPALLVNCVVSHRSYVANMRKFKKDFYISTFATFRNDCEAVFDALDDLLLEKGATEAVYKRVATDFIAALDANWKANKCSSLIRDGDRFLIALYLVPAIRELKTMTGEDFCRVLQETWCECYPKDPFFIGEYDHISESFRNKMCFITSAVCKASGKPDDCYELTTLRAFRDGWLTSCPDGSELINEYYDCAPAIVLLMELCGDNESICDDLRIRYIEPCLRHIEAGRNEECKALYTDMVRGLQKKYLMA